MATLLEMQTLKKAKCCRRTCRKNQFRVEYNRLILCKWKFEGAFLVLETWETSNVAMFHGVHRLIKDKRHESDIEKSLSNKNPASQSGYITDEVNLWRKVQSK